jgi:putative two-component system response regulator
MLNDMINRARSGASEVPIVFVTAHSSPEEERQALQAGAVEFLQKPLSKDALLLAIRNALKL